MIRPSYLVQNINFTFLSVMPSHGPYTNFNYFIVLIIAHLYN